MMVAQMTFRPVDAVDPYRNLAAAVLARAVADNGAYGGRRWILRRGRWMRFWCDMAGLNVECVRDTLLKRVA